MILTYVYDGSYEGFLTALYEIFSSGVFKKDVRIVSKKDYQPSFFEEVIEVFSAKDKSERMIKQVISLSDAQVYKKLRYAFLCDFVNKEYYLFRYILLIFKYKRKLKYFYHDDIVNIIEKSYKNVSREIGKYMGLLRFKEIEGNILYAKFEPANDIIVPISYFFKNRLKEHNWIIHDLKRKKACIYDKKRITFCELNEKELDHLKDDHFYQTLWKSYFKTMAIEERKNYKLQRQNMPKKYWKYLIEKSPD